MSCPRCHSPLVGVVVPGQTLPDAPPAADGQADGRGMTLDDFRVALKLVSHYVFPKK